MLNRVHHIQEQDHRDQFFDRNIPSNPFDITMRAKRIMSSNPFEAIRILKNGLKLFPKNSHIITILIKAYGITKNKREIINMYEYAKEKQGISEENNILDVVMYNTLFEALYRKHRKYYDEMLKLKIKPDVETYGLLIKTATSPGEAQFYYEEMKRMHLRPTIQIYNSLIHQCKSYKKAIYYLNEMYGYRIIPDDKILSQLVQKANKYEEILECIKDMRDFNITLDLLSNNIIINKMFELGKYNELITFIDTTRNEIRKDISIQILKLEAYKKLKDYQKVLTTIKHLNINSADNSQQIRINCIKAYCLYESNQTKEAIQLFKKIIETAPKNDPNYPRAVCGYIFAKDEFTSEEINKFGTYLIQTEAKGLGKSQNIHRAILKLHNFKSKTKK